MWLAERGNGAQYNGRSIKLGSELFWFMFQRDYSTWIAVVARVAAGRPEGGAAPGRDDGGLDQSDNGEGEGWVRAEGTECREIDCFCGLNNRMDVSIIN